MEMLNHLWLPIVLSAAAVWIASAAAWMALPHHKNDFKRLPDEEGFVRSLRTMGIPPGNYGFPRCESHAQTKDPEFQKRWKEGPNGLLSVWGRVSMGRNMVLTFLVYLVVSFLIAYLGTAAPLPRGASFGHVFQVLGTAGVLAYTFGGVPSSIWFGAYPRTILMNVIDGIVYGLITGAIFAWLWPGM
jgi:hypothetical protein